MLVSIFVPLTLHQALISFERFSLALSERKYDTPSVSIFLPSSLSNAATSLWIVFSVSDFFLSPKHQTYPEKSSTTTSSHLNPFSDLHWRFKQVVTEALTCPLGRASSPPLYRAMFCLCPGAGITR